MTLKYFGLFLATAVLLIAGWGGAHVYKELQTGAGSSVLRDAIRLQEVYGPQNFPTQAILITQIRLRPSATAGSAFVGARVSGRKSAELKPLFSRRQRSCSGSSMTDQSGR